MDNNDHPVILFDGVCNLCSAFVIFVIKRDPLARLRFASLQSRYARLKLQEIGRNPDALHTVIFIEHGKVFERSDAALEICRYLNGAWPALRIVLIFPRFLRNWVYDVISRNRYKWFGRKDACMVPTPELKARFLE
ncbi:MAG TPA: thiol-disulfide oxidoreductase DCC family protein [Ohtaekwangia sp.]|nr:thiol-disulfide oxidoreductase DCC family protein [Ohtaekwangia sp.]